MKYLVMIYSNPASRAVWDGFSDAEKAAGLKVYAALVEELAATGELVVTEALADSSHARRPVPLAGDGPYAEAKEHLAGSSSSTARAWSGRWRSPHASPSRRTGWSRCGRR